MLVTRSYKLYTREHNQCMHNWYRFPLYTHTYCIDTIVDCAVSSVYTNVYTNGSRCDVHRHTSRTSRSSTGKRREYLRARLN